MTKMSLPVLAIVLVFLGASQAATTLEWPSNLVALSSSKSSQLVPVAGQDSGELSDSSTSSAVGSVEAEEEDLNQSPSNNSDAADETETVLPGLVSAVPVSVPLPLIVAARSGLRTVLTIQEPTVAKVGEVVQHIPTAISHQSQTVVHDHRRLVTPIVAPALRTTQVVRQRAPLIWTVASSDPRVLLLHN
ncbi:uncharacterized protein Dwil_GK28283 [Drosophila willistoni]|uniref:Retinin n=1 Tax=Drosophila willistoni TaxID=7260 RepID=A0A0Q9WZD7_DROWI|nr:retinin [Drosophila willistoni]KRF97788.1 uncharacterized protein Dwil_GK28283 [Drosophila willistoni]